MPKTNLPSQRTLSHQGLGWLAAAAVLALGARECAAADSTDGAARAARDSRQAAQAVPEAQAQPNLIELLNPLPKAKIKLLVGVAHDSAADDTRTDNALYNFTYQTPGVDVPIPGSDPKAKENIDWWKFQAIGDGFTRIATPGTGDQLGVADAKFNVFRGFRHGLSVGAGVNVPTHGEVGSTRLAERLQLIWSPDFNKTWSGVFIVTALHAPTGKAGQSDFAQRGYAEIDYNVDEGHTVLVNVDRSIRHGTPSTSTVAIEYDFPFHDKSVTGAISASQGLTAGARHTGVEFDVVFKY